MPPGDPPLPLPGIGLGGEPAKIRVGTETGFRICGLPIRPLTQPGQTNPEPLGVTPTKGVSSPITSILHGQGVDVSDRSPYSNRETGAPGQASYEAHSVASQENWRIPESLEKEIPVPKTLHQHLKCWTKEENVLPGQPLHPLHHAVQVFTDASKEGWGAHRRFHSKRLLVSSRKSITHKLKDGLPGLNKIPTLSRETSCSHCHRQHHNCGIHQQGGRDEVRLTLCPSLAPPVLVQSETCCPKGKAHSRPSECDCGQAIPTRSDNPDGMVPSPGGVRPPVSNLAQTTGRHVCDQIQLQTNQVHVPSPGPERLSSRCSNSLLGGSRHVRISPSTSSGQRDQQTIRSSLPNTCSNPDSPRLAQHAMVLGSSGSFISDTHMSPKPSRSGDSTNGAHHRDLASLNLHAWLLEPRQSRSRGSLAQWCYSLRLLRDTQPEQSMRQSGPFLLDGVGQDFRSPSAKQIADFLLHLFQEKHLQPSTIDGYRSAIADKLGNASLNISKDENLTRLLDSFHRDRPKGRRGFPSWNLSLVLH